MIASHLVSHGTDLSLVYDEASDHFSDDYETRTFGQGATIGKYNNAVHHKDGVTSTILRAEASESFTNSAVFWRKGLVALKVVRLSAVQPPHDVHREKRLLEQFPHTNIVALLETFTTKSGDFVLVFPFLPRDLGDVLARGPLPTARARQVTEDLLNALAYIHSLGIVHRDIKPSNILLKGSSGPAILADFGIAWKADDAASEPATAKILDVGTTSYRAPELLFGNQRYGTGFDMWAAGCVIAQIVTFGGRTLFESGDLGSDLTLIKSIFETLGTPDEQTWPEVATFPDWGKMTFREYPAKSWADILPDAASDARDLIGAMVWYESGERLSAVEALEHPWFVHT